MPSVKPLCAVLLFFPLVDFFVRSLRSLQQQLTTLNLLLTCGVCSQSLRCGGRGFGHQKQ